MSVEHAFDEVCQDAKATGKWYVTLWCDSPYYGGPEEGGWWGSDSVPVKYKVFHTEEAAEAAREAITKLAKKMTQEASRSFGQRCLDEMTWCEARGLDADYLPEVDGSDNYYVSVSDSPPEPSYGCRHYS
jgi:hypothetical protein